VSEGIVYILTNAAMPGFIKIGLTQQDDVSLRVKGLDNTSLPLPFECYFSARVPDCRKLERTLHFVFGEKRARLNREFFTASPDLAKAIIELVAIQNVTPSDADQDITPEERREIEAEKVKRTLGGLGIEPGTELVFVKDPAITCLVHDAKKVSFRGEVLSLSKAALVAIHEMGFTWPTANGFEYWSLNGKRLVDLPMPVEVADDEEDEA
jgi:hypothetical protein